MPGHSGGGGDEVVARGLGVKRGAGQRLGHHPGAVQRVDVAQLNGELQALTEKKLLELGVKPHRSAWFVSLDGRSNSQVRHSCIGLQAGGGGRSTGIAWTRASRLHARRPRSGPAEGSGKPRPPPRRRRHPPLPAPRAWRSSGDTEQAAARAAQASAPPEDNSLTPLLDEVGGARGPGGPRYGAGPQPRGQFSQQRQRVRRGRSPARRGRGWGGVGRPRRPESPRRWRKAARSTIPTSWCPAWPPPGGPGPRGLPQSRSGGRGAVLAPHPPWERARALGCPGEYVLGCAVREGTTSSRLCEEVRGDQTSMEVLEEKAGWEGQCLPWRGWLQKTPVGPGGGRQRGLSLPSPEAGRESG